MGKGLAILIKRTMFASFLNTALVSLQNPSGLQT